MNSLEVLSCLAIIPQHSVGVFPADQIPRVWTKPTAYVFNTDNHFKPGSHWVAAYADTLENGWYFDSFGLAPIIPDHINRLRKNCKRLRWNTTHLQSLSSDVCGQYCIMFLYYMSKGLGIEKFLNNFSTDLFRNDEIVKNFISSKKIKNKFVGYGGCYNVKYLQSSCCRMSLL